MPGSGDIQGALTVDLEEWFQGLTSTNPRVDLWPHLGSRVVPATEQLLGLLAQREVRATFFVLGAVAERHPDLIRRVVEAGHEVGVHGYRHRFLTRMTPMEFGEELDRGLEAVREAAGREILGHRAPYFSLNGSTSWAFEIIRSRGLSYDSSVFPARSRLYGYPGAPRAPHRVGGNGGLVEFPISTLRLGPTRLPVGGGFYLRLWPYPLVRWALRRIVDEGLPIVLYLHPWELDLAQPDHPVTPRERITHRHGRRTLRPKLERLLDDFRLGPLEELLDTV
ncbi:MAG: DUF3473 domain-containing protein [Anaerolineae bacterium]|nr:DUF3473 domain-containing protein [Anaerolineae bacterium]